MYCALLRTAGVAALAAVAIAYTLAPSRSHRPLDPYEPIAADGSMVAGRAATIYDTNPLLRARSSVASDDPADFERIIKIEHPFIAHDRSPFTRLLGRLDWSLCQGSDRQLLMMAVRSYYEERGRLLAEFSHRGPRAKSAMDREYSTPADREIDDYVRHALQYGILQKSDFPARTYPDFARTFADVQQLGNGCTAPGR
jgi:hypothetical protein